MIRNTPLSKKNHTHERAFAILNQIALGRARVYRWLVLAFNAPDQELRQAIVDAILPSEIKAATAWLGPEQARLWPALDALQPKDLALETLISDYRRLSTEGLDRISMRESAYRWRDAHDLIQDAQAFTLALRQEYSHHGISVTNSEPDHIAVELEFLAYLSEREAYLWVEQASDAARQLRRYEHAFIHDHLGRWLPEFAQRVCERMPHSIYAAFARLSDAWLSIEYGPGYPLGGRG